MLQFSTIYRTFYQKKILKKDLGSGIRAKRPVPDPGSEGQKGTKYSTVIRPNFLPRAGA
jgi:hypothetical protein